MRPRSLPPYGRRVVAILRDPRRLATFSGCTPTRSTLWLIAGPGTWDIAAARPNHLCLVLPDGEDPAAYRWDMLRGCDPVMLDGPDAYDSDRRREIAAALFRDGVRRVLAGRLLMVASGEQVAA